MKRARSLKIGNGLDDGIEMGPQINQQQVETSEKYVKIGKDEGAKLLCGGRRLTDGAYAHGWFFDPTVNADVDQCVFLSGRSLKPVVAVIPCRDLDAAIEISNGVRYGLSSSIYTRDVNKAFRAMRDLYTGITYVNAPTIGAEVHLPFGGTKATGNGHRESGTAVIDFYSEWKTLYVDYSDRLQRAQIDRPE